MTELDDSAGPISGSARQLILMRHAKSDWADESLSDHDRPLNARGRRDAPRMAQWLADQELLPERMLISSSHRTRETAALMMEAWGFEPDTVFSEELYHASPGDILAAAQIDGVDSNRLMILAHNPGMTSLVSHFARDFMEMPTAAIAVFETDCQSWKELQPGTSTKLREFMRPKGLN